jgi:hypothetical protein
VYDAIRRNLEFKKYSFSSHATPNIPYKVPLFNNKRKKGLVFEDLVLCETRLPIIRCC